MVTSVFSFPDRFRNAREAAGLSREAVAESVGRSADSVAAWEQGRNRPRRSTLVRLADVLNVTVAELDR